MSKESKIRKQKIKENKKYIKNKTINKQIPVNEILDDDICIKVDHAWKIVANEDKRYDLIKDVSTNIYKNQFLVIFGESGSGKTTLLSILSGLDRPSEGIVNILGTNTPALKNSELTSLREKYIGYIFQQYGLLKEVSLIENVLITTTPQVQKHWFKLNRNLINIEYKVNKLINETNKLTLAGSINYEKSWSTNLINFDFYDINLPKINIVGHKLIFKKEWLNLYNEIGSQYIDFYRDYLFDGDYIYELLKKLDIHKFLNSDVNNLSGGQQQRVSIARSLAKKPAIIFADEPTGAVDAKTAKCIMQLFLDLMKEGVTIVMVTHNNNLIHLSDRILKLDSGQIIKDELNQNKKTINEINFE